MKIHLAGLVFVALVLGMAAAPPPAEAAPHSPRIESSQTPRIFLESAEIELAEVKAIQALDGTSLYRLTLTLGELSKSLVGRDMEYEIRAADGTTAGGGMFTVHPEMLPPDKKGISVLTGFGGLKITPQHLFVIRFVDLGLGSGGRDPQAKNITDTCTTFCEVCADKSAALCTQGVSNYSCSCGPETRSCSFSCQAGKPQV